MGKVKRIFMAFGLVFLAFVANTHYLSADDLTVDDIYRSIRQSDPRFQWDESIVTFQNEGMNLVCTLTIPRTKKLCPIVITLNGFTGNRNDGIIPGTDEPFYKRLSRMMAEQGLASLRVDFRGSGDSDGDFSMTTFSTQISDAIAAIDYIEDNLKGKVDTKSIGIIGFSQGGLVGSVVASRDTRVGSLVTWSAVANPPLCYEGLLTKEGIKQGLALPDGGSGSFGIYVEGQYYFDINLGKGFFQDLFKIDPIGEIHKYKKPLMVVCGTQDVVVWPQPGMGELFLSHHDGQEKLVVMDADHNYFSWSGPTVSDEVNYWSIAWFIQTLKFKN